MTGTSKRASPSKKSLLIVAAAFVCGWIGAAGLGWYALPPEPRRTFPLPHNCRCLGLSAGEAAYLTEDLSFYQEIGSDGSLIDDRSVGRARFWNLTTGREGAAVEEPAAAFRYMSPSRRFLVRIGRKGTEIKLWNADEGTEYAEFPGSSIIVFSSDDRWFAVTGPDQRSVRVWSAAEGREKFRVPCSAFVPVAKKMFGADSGGKLSFSLDGGLLAVADGSAIRLWDVVNGEERAHLAGHQDAVRTLAFSPDGRTLASLAAPRLPAWSLGADGVIPGAVEDTSPDGELRLWETANGRLIACIKLEEIDNLRFASRQLHMHFHPFGEEIVLGKCTTFRVDELMKSRSVRIAVDESLENDLTFAFNLIQPGVPNLSHSGPGSTCEVYNPNGNFAVQYEAASNAIRVREKTGASWEITPENGLLSTGIAPLSIGIAPDETTLFIASRSYRKDSQTAPSWFLELLWRMGMMNIRSETPFQVELWDLPSRKLVGVVPLQGDFIFCRKGLITRRSPLPAKGSSSPGIPYNFLNPWWAIDDGVIIWDIPPGKPWKPIVLIATLFAVLTALMTALLLRLFRRGGVTNADEEKTASAAGIQG